MSLARCFKTIEQIDSSSTFHLFFRAAAYSADSLTHQSTSWTQIHSLILHNLYNNSSSRAYSFLYFYFFMIINNNSLHEYNFIDSSFRVQFWLEHSLILYRLTCIIAHRLSSISLFLIFVFMHLK